MHNEIKHLRRKFCILSASISFVVIFLMLFILNLLMNIAFGSELKAASDILSQTAIASIPDVESETIVLSEMITDENGNYIIDRNPKTIQSITVNGEIKCSNDKAEWYCAGGGIYFEYIPDEGADRKLIHKEYKFNQGNTKIEVDFTDNTSFIYEEKPFSANIMNVSEERFYISPVWWSMASTSYDNHNDDVILDISSIDIQYRENASAVQNKNYKPKKSTIETIYPSGIPYTLNSFIFFYIIEDKQGNIVELNSGNTEFTDKRHDIEDIVEDKSYHDIKIDNIKYKYFSATTDEFNIHIFIHSTLANQSGSILVIISVLSGGFVLLVVFILIYFVSGRAVKPIKDGYEKQNQFISNASHELKTPITVISATTQLMKKKFGADTLLGCIQAQSEKMGRLVNEMLTLTRITDSGRQLNEFKQFDLSKTVKKNALYFEGRAFEEGKKIKTDIQEDVSFNGIENKIDELVGILLDNALKYSDDGSVIELELHSEKEKIMLCCKNKCQGFDEKNIPYMFERFHRCDKAHSEKREGFGLGLAIAEEIVNIHKGTINAKYLDNCVIFIIKL
ncbi:sensor histidine kinase [Porcipelethomonas sp.]|uniref:sensor histidine kinase n=1 Tax=Porcipelethomonas sp. TaxID=2981675 RepID=UPI003EF5381E